MKSVVESKAQAKPDEGGAMMIDTSGSGKGATKPAPSTTTRTSRCNHPSSTKCVHCMASAKEEKKEDGPVY